ncbi:hypothetical protein GCM10010172_80330 [Paractinoplanes ferrugineus]|uniref:Uncharacterized protein n=1 Tax=Paractinoplanes ferrugineus TaxID=113564 RepID=A0A919J905_9ACTN|nr:hypothetical protein [Actinoplanes ferrugineus]GIE16750.1 hypothetical protein Afe05nite_85900 [Actinoplanes ferrugineus]
MEAGTETQDLRALTHTIDETSDNIGHTEKQTRRRGQRCFWSGLGIIFATFLLCLATAIISEQNVYHSRAGQLFGVLAIIPLMLAGLALVIVGGLEHRHRPERAASRGTFAATQRNSLLLERLRVDHDERYQTLFGLTAPVPGRLAELTERVAALETTVEKVPDYGQAVLDGVELGRREIRH